MSSKSRGGLSRREFAAKQSRGSLNYKTGKISTPQKSSYKAPSRSSSSSFDPEEYTRDIYNALPASSPAKVSAAQHPGGFAAEEKKASDSKKKSKSSPKPAPVVAPTQRSAASNAYNSVKNFVNTAPQRVGNGRGLFSSIVNKGAAEAGGLWDTLRGEGVGKTLNQLKEDVMLGMRNPRGLLGKEANAMEFELAPGVSIDERGIMRSDPTNPNNPSATPENIINLGRGPINVPGVTDTGVNGGNNRQQPTPINKPTPGISNPFNIPSPFIPQSGISNAYQSVPDNTPIAPENGTVRRPVGMGEFSSGQYGNGAGDYGLGGGFGNQMDDEQSLLNKILGIKTANAEGVDDWTAGMDPGTPEYQESTDNYNKYTEYQNQIAALEREMELEPTTSLDKIESYQPTGMGGGAELSNYNLSNMRSNRISNNLLTPLGQQYWGTPSPAYNQTQNENYVAPDEGTEYPDYGNTGQGMPQPPSMPKFDTGSSGYKAQEKAQKKALKELLKSIESQYQTDVKTGTSELGKAKQEDLMKLSGLFGFANSDPNDEQRIQYQTRTTDDYTGRLNELLSQLSQGRNQSISQGKQGYQNALAQIAEAKSAAQQRVAQLQQQWQQQQFENSLKLYGLNNKKVTTTPKKTWTDPATGDIYEEA